MQRYSQNTYMLPDQNGAYVSAKDAEELQRRLNEALKQLDACEQFLTKAIGAIEKPHSIGLSRIFEIRKNIRILFNENKYEQAPPSWQPAEAEPEDRPLTQAEAVGKLGEFARPVRTEQRTAQFNLHVEMQESFTKHMIGFEYGPDEKANAEYWFTSGFRSGALRGLAMKASAESIELPNIGIASIQPSPALNAIDEHQSKCAIKQAYKTGTAPDTCKTCGLGPCPKWPASKPAEQLPKCRRELMEDGIYPGRACAKCGSDQFCTKSTPSA